MVGLESVVANLFDANNEWTTEVKGSAGVAKEVGWKRERFCENGLQEVYVWGAGVGNWALQLKPDSPVNQRRRALVGRKAEKSNNTNRHSNSEQQWIRSSGHQSASLEPGT